MLLFVSYLQLIRALHRVVRPASLSVKCDVVTTNAINENVTKDLNHVKCTQGDKDGNVNLEVRCNVVTDDAVIKKHRKVCKDVKSTHKDKNRNIMFHKNMKAIKFILGLICIFVFFSSGMFMFRCLTFFDLLYEDFAIKFKTYKHTMRAIGLLMFQFNSSVNPFLYFLTVPKIKRSIVEMLK